MQIGILSDIHDHLTHLDLALKVAKERGVAKLIFCGDFCSPIAARALAVFDGEVHCIFGNGDADRFAMLNFANTDGKNLILHGDHAEIELAGRRIAMIHFPFATSALARSGDYDAVFYGHTHNADLERVGDCLRLNPGDIMGWRNPASMAFYDTETNDAEVVILP